MNALRSLVVATDLSGPSLRALERGLQLAAAHGARLEVVHALGTTQLDALRDWLGGQAEDAARRVAEHRRRALARIVAETARSGRQRPRDGADAERDDPDATGGAIAGTRVRVEAGHPADVVPAAADAADADLVLIGAHGHGFLQRVLLGSTASTLVRTVRRPVLVAKSPGRAAYRRALLPVDFSPASADALGIVRRWFPDVEPVLLHAFEPPFDGMLRYAGVDDDTIHRYRIEARTRAFDRLHALAHGAGLAPHAYVGDVQLGHPVRRIVAAERHHACDLVVLGKHGTRVTEELLLGSVTKQVLAESRSDVLVITDPRRPGAAPERPAQ